MKLIKNYFLWMVYGPFIINIVFFIITMLGIVIWGGLASHDVNKFHELTGSLIIGLLAIVTSNLILTFVVKAKCITFPSNEKNWRLVLINNDGKKTVVNKAVWKKGTEYFLYTPCNYQGLSGLETSIVINISGKYKNTTLTIPVKIILTLNKKFDELELFNVLYDYFPYNKRLDVHDYMQDMLRKLNADHQKKIDDTMSRYVQKLISEPELLNEIVEKLIFPERLFENVAGTKIFAEKVKVSACKDLTCEPAKPGKIITVEN
jgi:hypothetical protein